MHYQYLLVLLFFLCVQSAPLIGQLPYQTAPKVAADGWATASLMKANLDTTAYGKLHRALAKQEHKLHGMVLIRNNQLVFETYYDKHSATSLHDLRSVTKSIIGLLTGIALEKNWIQSIDDPLIKYLPHYFPDKPDELKASITLRHLLTMSTGLDCNDWDKKSKGQEDRLYRKKDWLRSLLAVPMNHAPGDTSFYCTGGVMLMAKILEKTSGLELDQLTQIHLFTPLGISNTRWDHTNRKEAVSVGKRLFLAPRDLAKIGQLVLQMGTWEGQSIVSAEWIQLSTTTHTTITGVNYGFLWWQFPFIIDEKVHFAHMASGNGGQYIFVLPEYNLVAVFTGGGYNSAEANLPFSIMQDIVLPSVK